MSDSTKEQVQVDPLDNPVVNGATKQFMQSVPVVRELSTKVSQRALKRVLNAVVEFPLQDKYPNFKAGSLEQQLFITALAALEAKHVMMEAFKLSKEEKESMIVDPIVDSVREQVNNDSNKEESDGSMG